MKKKLSLLLVVFLLVLVGKSQAYTVTQISGDTSIEATVKVGSEVEIEFIGPDSLGFIDWEVKDNVVTLKYETDTRATFKMIEKDIIVTAKYYDNTQTITKYTVTYNANGGTGTMNSQTVIAGNKLTLSANMFARSGYTFIGWSPNSSATSATYTDGQTITPTGSMLLYAIWKQNITPIPTPEQCDHTFDDPISGGCAICDSSFNACCTKCGWTCTHEELECPSDGTYYCITCGFAVCWQCKSYDGWCDCGEPDEPAEECGKCGTTDDVATWTCEEGHTRTRCPSCYNEERNFFGDECPDCSM